MPSFAELRDRAAKVTETGIQKARNVKDHNTSVPLKSTNWDPYTKRSPPPPAPKPPPPPKPSFPPPPPSHNKPTQPAPSPFTGKPKPYIPPRLEPVRDDLPPTPPPPRRGPTSPSSASASTSFSPPPPPSSRASVKPSPTLSHSAPPPVLDRSRRPDLTRSGVSSSTQIDWANLSEEDKEVFFSWLDEFFSRTLNIELPPRTKEEPPSGPPQINSSTRPNPFRAPSSTPRSPANPFRGPAASPGPSQLSSNSSGFTLSHPPPTQHGSAALDLAHYFSPSTPWPDHWYNTTQMAAPPPIVGSKDIYWSSSWQTYGPTKTVFIGVLFSDLSVFWGTIEFPISNPGNAKRDAQYLPVPPALSKRELEQAHETYGETIASFAESFAGTGEYCARGECWDLANEALKYFNEYDYVPKPVRSISRTHGHLIFEGKASRNGAEMVGRWRGGDDRVRRGDIVEWRKVKISIKGFGGRVTGWATLGDPDHTAVIVQDTIPTINVQDGKSITPKQLGSLVVVEQSVGSPPERKEYNLEGMDEGEMWIYRPISMEAYLGINEVIARAPEGNTRLLRL